MNRYPILKLQIAVPTVCILWWIATTARAQPEEILDVVMIAPEADVDRFDALFENVRAQMSDLPVNVRMVRVSGPIDLSKEGFLERATRVSEETGSRLIFGSNMTEEGGRAVFWVRGAEGDRLLVRTLRGAGKEGIADAVSLIARTTVETLLEIGALRGPVPEPHASPPQTPRESEPPPIADAPVLPIIEHSPSWGFALRAAYVSQWVSFAPRVTHGGGVALQGIWSDLLRISFGVTLSNPDESVAATVRMTRFKVPFQLGISAMSEVGRWRLGGTAEAIFAWLRLSPESLSDSVVVSDPFDRFGFSAAVLAEIEYHLVDRILLFFSGGAEILADIPVYRVAGGPVLFADTARIQPRLTAGLSVLLR